MPHPDRPSRRSRTWLLLSVLAAIALIVPAGATAHQRPKPPVEIQFLNVSDWHGNLDPLSGVGGAGAISALWKYDRSLNPNTITLTAGDDFGATPPLSGFFDEKPAVLAERIMGIQVGTLGNHNFDRGTTHLQSMVKLAGARTDAAHPGTPYRYVSANLDKLYKNVRGVAPMEFFRVGGVTVAVIGVTNPEAPGLVTPGNFGTIVPTDPVKAANKARILARLAGASVVVAITHMGVRGFDSTGNAFGELVDFANASHGFDVIFGDHTDIQYSGTINGQLVHENRSFGVTYAKTALTVDPNTRKVTAKSVSFVSPTATLLTSLGLVSDPAIETMLAPYRAELSALLDGPIGTATDIFQRGGNLERRQETPSGDLVTDGMRWKYGTDIAVLTGGSLRSALPACGYAPADHTLHRSGYQTAPNTNLQPCTSVVGGVSTPYASGAPYDLVKGDVYTILPFGNSIITRSVTGKQIWSMLENGVSRFAADGTNGQGRFVQASGLKYTFHYQNLSGCTGDRYRQELVGVLPIASDRGHAHRRHADPERRDDIHHGDDQLHERRGRRDVDVGGRPGRELRPGRQRHARIHAVRRAGVRSERLSAGPHHQAALIVRAGRRRGRASSLGLFARSRMDGSAIGRAGSWRSIGRVLLCLLVVVLSPATVLAHAGGAPFVHVPLDHVIAGTDFPVIGADLGPGADVVLSMSLAGQTADLGTVVAGPDGHFEVSCTLPGDFPDGYASLVATAADGTSAQAYVLVGARTEGTVEPPSTGSSPIWADPRDRLRVAHRGSAGRPRGPVDPPEGRSPVAVAGRP